MQRWYEQPQETIKTVPPTTTNPHVSPTIIERRYDMATMQKAVEIASQMQADHQVTLSTQEIEAIAAEAGIESRFIRQALSLAEKEVSTKQAISTRTHHHSRRRLSKRTSFLVFGLPLIYSLLLFLLIVTTSRGWGSSLWTVLLFLVLPGLITLFSAASLRRISQGAWAGLMMGLGVFFALILGILSTANGSGGDFTGVWLALFCFTIGGTLIGATTTYLRRNIPRWIADKN